MKVIISHEFNTDAESFWTKLFFNPEFNRALYLHELGFARYEILEERDAGHEVIRRLRVTPKQNAPAAIQKLLGTDFSYIEEGRFDKAAKRYRLRVIPSSMGDKVKSEGELRVEDVGPKRIKRVAEMTIEVKIFGVGGMIEGFVSKSMQESYAKAAAFTTKWIADKGL